MYPSVLGFVAVDGFFVLTGFLLGYPLFEGEVKKRRALAASKDKVDGGSTVTSRVDTSFSVKDWLYRRIARMVPLYLIMLCIHWYVVLSLPFYSIVACCAYFILL
jgi:peptidoglycan/LPS O-acetylase OafA/YrhL